MADIRLHNVNCMEFMKGCEPHEFDLAIIDPPYGIGEDGRRSKSRGGMVTQRNGSKTFVSADKYIPKTWDDYRPPQEYYKVLDPIVKETIIWGIFYLKEIRHPDFFKWEVGRKMPRRNEIQEFIDRNPYHYIIWDKCNGETDFNDVEIAFTTIHKKTAVFSFLWNGMIQGKSLEEPTIQQGNKGLNEKRIHPTQKPVPLYKWLLKNYASPGNRILDTHGGSMSIAIACYDLGFDLDLCELDPDYFKGGQARLDAHIAKYAPASEIPVNKKGEIKLFKNKI